MRIRPSARNAAAACASLRTHPDGRAAQAIPPACVASQSWRRLLRLRLAFDDLGDLLADDGMNVEPFLAVHENEDEMIVEKIRHPLNAVGRLVLQEAIPVRTDLVKPRSV